MLCDVCRERDATVTLTHAVKGEVNVLHLCQRCAADRGIETSITTPLKNMIADYLPAVQASQALTSQLDSMRCAFCSMSLADFRESGRLGCASCYTTFDQSLRALLRRVHGNAKHAGRQYDAPPPDLLHEVTALGELRERLRRAIAQEEFEQAAQLRDQIRGME
jgi:protein arginine kinase activator